MGAGGREPPTADKGGVGLFLRGHHAIRTVALTIVSPTPIAASTAVATGNDRGRGDAQVLEGKGSQTMTGVTATALATVGICRGQRQE